MEFCKDHRFELGAVVAIVHHKPDVPDHDEGSCICCGNVPQGGSCICNSQENLTPEEVNFLDDLLRRRVYPA